MAAAGLATSPSLSQAEAGSGRVRGSTLALLGSGQSSLISVGHTGRASQFHARTGPGHGKTA